MADAPYLTGQQARDKVRELISDIKFTLMTSYDEKTGRLHSRPMTPQNAKEFDGTLWFFASSESEKTQELYENRISQLTFAATGKNDYVSIAGKATVVKDQAKINALWSEPMKAWFPNGPTSPNLVLIRFDAEEAEFWDSPMALATAYAYVKARLTGEEIEHLGETGKAEYKKVV